MDFTKFKPLREIILVKRDPKKSEDGGILIPESWQQYGWRATIVAVGEGAEHYKPGEQIMFLKEYTVLPFPERDMATTHADHILAKIVVENFVERLIPQNKFVLLVENPPNQSKRGVVIPNQTQNIKSGWVIRVSDKCLDLQAGMTVLYEKSVVSCTEDGKFLKMVDEGDVLCVQS